MIPKHHQQLQCAIIQWRTQQCICSSHLSFSRRTPSLRWTDKIDQKQANKFNKWLRNVFSYLLKLNAIYPPILLVFWREHNIFVFLNKCLQFEFRISFFFFLAYIFYMSLSDEMLIEKLKDIIAEAGEFSLDLLLVVLKELKVLWSLRFFLLLNRWNRSPGGSSWSNGVLVSDWE